MSERFLKFIPSQEAFWLMQNKPKAFLLLSHIANTARRESGYPDGLLIGQCHLQHWTFYGFTEREYRTAKNILIQRKHIIIIETNRTRKKSTTGTTTKSTLVQLCSTTVYDINPNSKDDRIDDRETTDRRLTDDKQEGRRMIKNEKESHPSIPSFRKSADRDDLVDGRTDDFSFEKEKIEVIPGVLLTQNDLDACIKIKGDIDKVKHAMEYIQSSKKRKQTITDWPNALMRWKIENKPQARIEDNLDYAEKLCKEFQEYHNGHGWRCYMYVDRKKDERGILFECQSVYQKTFFAGFADGQFKQKCEDFIRQKNMRKIEKINFRS
jgi:hypothetical protein